MRVVLDPRWEPEESLRCAVETCHAWLALNGIEQPGGVFLTRDQADAHDRKMLSKDWIGVYLPAWEDRRSAIGVSVVDCLKRQCNLDEEDRVFWQAPGYASDWSPYGVYCHEVGHHVDHVLHKDAHSLKSKRFRRIVEDEMELGKEPDLKESFAEAVRLFVTNPDLLRQGWPQRWAYLREEVGLKPPHGRSWRTVLQRAHPHIRRLAARRIDEAE